MKDTIIIPEQHLKAAITHAAKNDIRYYLNGVHIERHSDGTVVIVATDGHRMLVGLTKRAEPGEPWTAILPCDGVKRALVGAGKAPLTLTIDTDEKGRNGLPLIQLGDISLEQIDGKYPDWRRVYHTDKANTPALAHWLNPLYLADARNAMMTWADRQSNALFGGSIMWDGPRTAAVVADDECPGVTCIVMSLHAAPSISTPISVPNFK